MRVEPGSRLGGYEVITVIGKGGMGEVYRARDPALEREVALKILPEELSQDPQFLARFEREAKLLAALNHPGIATIHALGEGEGIRFLVMELVEGETLADRIDRTGPLPVAEVLVLFEQVARALESAHEKGIVHRDLKPTNVMVTPEGRLKILDFGLAKEMAAEAIPDQETLARDLSTGLILGTAPYMSPEQVRGQATDRRSDIWAFGCTLFEVLAARPPFRGSTRAETLAAILEREPDWSGVPKRVPTSVKKLLKRCLRKDRVERLQHIGDARIEIADARGEPPADASEDTRPAGVRGVMAASFAVAAALAAGLVVWASMRSDHPSAPSPAPPERLVIDLPAGEKLLLSGAPTTGFPQPSLAISADGRRVAFVVEHDAGSRIYVRELSTFEPRAVPGTEGGFAPFFSPDGEWLGFFTEGKLKKIALAGGAPVTLADARNPYGASWGRDEAIIVAEHEGHTLSRVAAGGGSPEVLLRGGDMHWPQHLPSGRHVLVSPPAIVSLDTRERTPLVNEGTQARYATSGHLVYAARGDLFTVPFRPESSKIEGTPKAIVQGIRTSGEAAQFGLADNGTLVYVPGGGSGQRSLVFRSRSGSVEPLDLPQQRYRTFRLSPDGKKLAIQVADATHDLWVHDLDRDTLGRLTFEAFNGFPLWSPDGTQVFYGSDRDGPLNLYRRAADGSGSVDRLTTTGTGHVPCDVTPDGRELVFEQADPKGGMDLWLLSLDSPPTTRPLLATPYAEWGAHFSPDGRYLAYTSDEPGRYEVYLQPFPAMDRRWQLSTQGGEEPVWSPRGDELFYRIGQTWMRVPIAVQPDLVIGRPERVFEGDYDNVVGLSYDVTADGERFLLLARAPEPDADRIHVVLRGFEGLRQDAQ